jgi:prepilin-type N-terminal cleavage/methylation domain-containing protein
MSRFIQKQGFTLIELMVVIVIIGVLASLAIPRFSEASAKAKLSEAPRVLASYESAFLTLLAEKGEGPTDKTDLIFEEPVSNWFQYTPTLSKTPTGNKMEAKASKDMGKFKVADGDALETSYDATLNDGSGCFQHKGTGTNAPTIGPKMVPNFFNDDMCK